MSGPRAGGAVPGVSAWAMYRSMVGVGLVCGFLIVSVFELTRPVIERKRAEALERAILEVVPGAESSRSFRWSAGERFEVATGGAKGERRIHAAYGAEGELVGVAIEAQGMGYQDTIRVIYGYAPERQTIVGLQVLESKETPGLGDKIEIDPRFRANFEALDVTVAESGSGLAQPVVAVKQGEKTEAWQVDGITGATISSKAIARILDLSAAEWAPRIRRQLDDLREPR